MRETWDPFPINTHKALLFDKKNINKKIAKEIPCYESLGCFECHGIEKQFCKLKDRNTP